MQTLKFTYTNGRKWTAKNTDFKSWQPKDESKEVWLVEYFQQIPHIGGKVQEERRYLIDSEDLLSVEIIEPNRHVVLKNPNLKTSVRVSVMTPKQRQGMTTVSSHSAVNDWHNWVIGDQVKCIECPDDRTDEVDFVGSVGTIIAKEDGSYDGRLVLLIKTQDVEGWASLDDEIKWVKVKDAD